MLEFFYFLCFLEKPLVTKSIILLAPFFLKIPQLIITPTMQIAISVISSDMYITSLRVSM